MIQGLPSSVMGLLAGRMVAGWLARGGFRKARYNRDWMCFQHHGCLSIREGRRFGGGWPGKPRRGVDDGKYARSLSSV